jgi:hypothetical protein
MDRRVRQGRRQTAEEYQRVRGRELRPAVIVGGWRQDRFRAQPAKLEERSGHRDRTGTPSGVDERSAADFCRSMIFSENRYPLFGIML